ncbi:hypothetical protein ONZ45_g19371 [Pleurotus djamor]|nr:hypothetical protein ONZ45_g19371 [Pleurotus djamor]
MRVLDHFTERHLEHLYATLPTRNGTRAPYERPAAGAPLHAGHHLVFFHPKHPEHALREDGTEPDFCPPEPFTRRMWVGGKIQWNQESVLKIGRKATADWRVESVVKKGFEEGKTPMVFVNQRILYTMEGSEDICIDEERNHVYIANASKGTKSPRPIKDIPESSDFSFSFTPTPVTLFRFSALIFNAHFNHLDKEFSQKIEGYPGMLNLVLADVPTE